MQYIHDLTTAYDARGRCLQHAGPSRASTSSHIRDSRFTVGDFRFHLKAAVADQYIRD